MNCTNNIFFDMSFDYLYDLFGRFIEKETKFSDVEERAKRLLSLYASGNIGRDAFGEQMEKVEIDFHALMKDDSGNYVFDQDTPGWLNLFLGNKFSRWDKMRKIMNVARQNQEMTSSPQWTEALEIFDAEEKRMKEAIVYCLEELG